MQLHPMPNKIQKNIFMYRVEFSGSKEIIITSYRKWLIAKSLNVDSDLS